MKQLKILIVITKLLISSFGFGSTPAPASTPTEGGALKAEDSPEKNHSEKQEIKEKKIILPISEVLNSFGYKFLQRKIPASHSLKILLAKDFTPRKNKNEKRPSLFVNEISLFDLSGKVFFYATQREKPPEEMNCYGKRGVVFIVSTDILDLYSHHISSHGDDCGTLDGAFHRKGSNFTPREEMYKDLSLIHI